MKHLLLSIKKWLTTYPFRGGLIASFRNPGIIVGGLMIIFIVGFIFRDKMPFFSATGNDPVAYWKFDEGTGSTVYDMVGSNDGTLGTGTSAPTWVTEDQCISGKCLRFDGVNDKLTSISSVGITGATSRTMSFWMNVKTAAGDSAGIGWGDLGFGQEFKAKVYQGEWYFWGYGGSYDIDTTTDINPSKWEYHTLVYDGQTVYWYINGQLMTSNTTTLNTANTVFSISVPQESQTYFHALVDEVKIYDYARTTAQIKADYASRGSTKGVAAGFGDDDLSRKLSSGLIGYWKMDEVGVSGSNWTAVDSSGNNNNGTGAGNASVGSTFPGKFGNTAYFDGVDDFITLNISKMPSGLNPKYTWSTWVYYRTSAAHQKIFTWGAASTNEGVYIGIYSDGTVGIDHFGNDWATGYAVPLGQWTHLAGTYDGNSTETLYANGVQVKQKKTVLSFTLGGTGAYIGQFFDGTEDMNSPLDEMRIYNRVLAPDEVKALYNFAPGPIAYWKLDEISGSTATDISGNANNMWNSSSSWTKGKYGNAFDGNEANWLCSGSGSCADDDDLDMGSNNFTLTMWYRCNSDTNPDSQVFMLAKQTSTNPGYAFRMQSSGKTGFIIHDGGTFPDDTIGNISSQADTCDGTWHHMVGVADRSSTSLKLYTDGVLTDSVNSLVATGSLDNALEFVVGDREGGDGTNEFPGDIDDVKVYRYARTPSQIIEDMNAGHPAVGTPVGSTVLHLKMDEGYGTTVQDWSPQNNDGNLGAGNSAPTWSNDGKFGKALSFDGTNDYLYIPSSSAFDLTTVATKPFSFSAWLKVTRTPATSGGQTIFTIGTSDYNSFSINLDDTGKMYLVGDTTGTNSWEILNKSTKAVSLNTWTQITVTRDTSGNYRFYMNGSDAGGGFTIANDLFINTATAKLGGHYSLNSAWYFGGVMDDIKLYPFALTSEQVKIDYAGGKTQVMGALSTGLGGTSPSFSAGRAYCVPGDSSTCSAPIGEWNFNENTGSTANDISGNGNYGFFGGGNSSPVWTTGIKGAALLYDGTDDYVGTNSSTSLVTGAFTMSGWAYFDTEKNYTGVFGKYNDCAGSPTIAYDFCIGAGAGGVMWAQVTNSAGSINLQNVINESYAGQWMYLSMVWDGVSNLKFYKNGVLRDSDTSALTLSTDHPVRFGTSPGRSMDGKIDEVRLYDYARTPAQIAWEYNRGAPVAYYKFEECTGTSIKDWGPNANGGYSGNTGTLTVGASGSQTSAGTCSSGTSTEAWNNGTTGKRAASLNFDGTDDYVNMGGAIVSGVPVTLSAWVNVASLPSNGLYTMVAIGDSGAASDVIRLSLTTSDGNDNFFIQQYDGSTAGDAYSSTTVSSKVGQWVHIAGVFTSDSSRTIYINGIPEKTDTTSVTTLNTQDYTNIGRLKWTSNIQYFNGQIDEVKIFNYALTPAQVKTEMAGGAVRFE